MNTKITLHELVDTIAELTNTSKRVSELFLKEFFGVIKERLEQGETVKVKNLGTFKVSEVAPRKSIDVNTGEEIEIASHRRVSFTPDKALAEAINLPFEGFETIILDDDISEEDLNELSNIDNEEDIEVESSNNEEDDSITPPPFNIVEENLQIENKNEANSEELAPIDDEVDIEINETLDEEQTVETIEEAKIEDNIVIDENDNAVESNKIQDIENDCENEISSEETIEEDSEEEIETEKRKSFVWGVLMGVVVTIIVLALAWFIVFGKDGIQANEDLNEENETVVLVKDSTKTEQLTPDNNIAQYENPSRNSTVVMDTVKANYFLTKMSRKYYGRYEFWVYIYEENKSLIKNPNSVSPGLVVVIPPAEKYGIDKNNPESVKKAKELAEKIL